MLNKKLIKFYVVVFLAVALVVGIVIYSIDFNAIVENVKEDV